ncbi:MAG: tetratricopeptide repeat protein [Rhizobiaceae bacterium]
MAKLSVSQSLQKAKKFEKRAQYHEARELYEAVLAAYPNNVRARDGLKALPAAGPDITQFSTPRQKIVEIVQQFEGGQYVHAIRNAKAIVKREPGLSVAWKVLGLANQRLENFADAEASFSRALQVEPNCFETHNNLGVVQQAQNKLDAAVASFEKSASANPRYFRAHFNLGIALREQGKFEDATAAFNQAISLNPDHAQSHYSLGSVQAELGATDKAIAAFEKAIELEPGFADAHDNLGVVFHRAGDLGAAIRHHSRAIQISPTRAQAHDNLGVVLFGQGKMKDAAESFGRAIQFDPKLVDAYCNRSRVFSELGQFEQANKDIQAALDIDPQYVPAMHEKINALEGVLSYAEALEWSEKVLQSEPDNTRLKAKTWSMSSQICAWELGERFENEMRQAEGEDAALQPWPMLTLQDAPQQHLNRSKIFGESIRLNKPSFSHEVLQSRPDRLRVGLFSPDFKDHPVAKLIAGLLRNFDRKRFEILAFSNGGNVQQLTQARIAMQVDKFVDLTEQSVDEKIALLKQNPIDIAIDLAGYTQGGCTDLLGLKVAPVQINFLGYAGSLGFDAIQYVIGDGVLMPPHSAAHYSEKVIRLPNSFMPTDDQLVVSDAPLTRSDCGLPEEGIVFCAFNKAYKIRPTEFDIWMKLLEDVEGSVLWLSGNNDLAIENLRQQAQKAGIDPQRLIVAGWVPDYASHLARLRLADMFVDTFNYNAHTTAVEALHAGLPVVTKCGQQFAARVVASLLNAVGLPELITETAHEYRELALDLAKNPEKLKTVREKLANLGPQSALFDSVQYTRDFERGLDLAYQRHLDGLPAADIDLAEAE